MSDLTDLIGEVIDAAIARRHPKCGMPGPTVDVQPCGRPPKHDGFHKSAHHIWPNEAETWEQRVAIGRRLMRGDYSLFVNLSLTELLYYREAAEQSRDAHFDLEVDPRTEGLR